MKQSKLMSWLETVLNTGIGFGISLAAQMAFLPLLGVQISHAQNFYFACIMTVISLARGFALRRLFEALHIRRPLSPFAQAVLAERRRQIEAEGWDTAHDDAHLTGEMALAGGCYAMTPWRRRQTMLKAGADGDRLWNPSWPWSMSWWKPQDDRRDLVRAGALILAEGERIDRTRKNRMAT